MSKAFSFASLLGRAMTRAEDGGDEPNNPDDVDEAKRAEWAKKAETDDERKQGDDESDEDYEARMLAMDEEEEDEDEEGRDPPPDDKADPDEDDDEDEKAKAARKSERVRCARIVAFGIKNNCVRQAGLLAFDTKLSAKEAIGVMKMGAADGRQARRGGLSERMQRVQIPVIAPDGGQKASGPQGNASLILAAARKARGQA